MKNGSVSEIVFWVFTRAFLAVILVCTSMLISACAPSGWHYEPWSLTQAPNDFCEKSFLNKPYFLRDLNETIGQPTGIPSEVSAITAASDDNSAARLGLIDKNRFPSAYSSGASFACHVTLALKDGQSVNGVVYVAQVTSKHLLFISWTSNTLMTKLENEYQKATGPSSAAAMQAYGERLNLCYFWGQIATQALSIKRTSKFGETQTANTLTNEYAFGPQGQAFQNSQDIEKLVQAVVHRIYTAQPPITYQSLEAVQNQCVKKAQGNGPLIPMLMSISPELRQNESGR